MNRYIISIVIAFSLLFATQLKALSFPNTLAYLSDEKTLTAQPDKTVAQVKGLEVTYTSIDLYTMMKNNVELNINSHGQSVRYTIVPGLNKTTQQRVFVDYKAKKFWTATTEPSSKVVNTTKTRFSSFSAPNNAKKVTIDIWECYAVERVHKGIKYTVYYTKDLGFTGTPFPEIGVPDGLVLKITANGIDVFDLTNIDRTILNEKFF